MNMEKIRLKYAYAFKLYLWTWDIPKFYSSVYYDGWNNQFNLGFFSINWMTPPLNTDI